MAPAKNKPEPEATAPVEVTPEKRVGAAKRAASAKRRSVITAEKHLDLAKAEVAVADQEVRDALKAYHQSELEALGLDPSLFDDSDDEPDVVEHTGTVVTDDDDFYDPEAEV